MKEKFENKIILLEYLSLTSGLGVVGTTIRNNSVADSIGNELWLVSVILSILILLYGLESTVFAQLQKFYFRKNTSAGLWICCLLPISLTLQIYYDEEISEHYFWMRRNEPVDYSEIYVQWMWFLTSAGTFVSSLILIMGVCIYSEPNKLYQHPGADLLFTALIGIGCAVMHLVVDIDFKTALFLSASSQFIFINLTHLLPKIFPRTFSLGEVLLISQAASSFVTSAICHIYFSFYLSELTNFSDQITLFIEICLLGSILAIRTCIRTCHSKPPLLYLLLSLISVGFICILPLIYLVLRVNPFVWIFNFVMDNNTRVMLFGLWFLLLFISILFAYYQILIPDNATTIMRKYFHLMILAVFFPGLSLDPLFLRFSSGLLLGIFLILEFIRCYRIPPIWNAINNIFKLFLDEKDKGPLILSHIYLLVGCSLPVWFCSTGITSYAGIISVGIGDACASVAGKLFGKIRWPGSVKTVEGTAVSIIAQSVTVYILLLNGLVSETALTSLIGIVIATSLLEAFTTQVDNLVVPLVFFTLVVPIVSLKKIK